MAGRGREEARTGIACTHCHKEIFAPIEMRPIVEGPGSFAKTDRLVPYCKSCAKRIDAQSKRR